MLRSDLMLGVKSSTRASQKKSEMEAIPDANFNPTRRPAWEQNKWTLLFMLFSLHFITWNTEGNDSNQIFATLATFLDY